MCMFMGGRTSSGSSGSVLAKAVLLTLSPPNWDRNIVMIDKSATVSRSRPKAFEICWLPEEHEINRYQHKRPSQPSQDSPPLVPGVTDR